jgi:hypothetical protein
MFQLQDRSGYANILRRNSSIDIAALRAHLQTGSGLLRWLEAE